MVTKYLKYIIKPTKCSVHGINTGFEKAKYICMMYCVKSCTWVSKNQNEALLLGNLDETLNCWLETTFSKTLSKM